MALLQEKHLMLPEPLYSRALELVDLATAFEAALSGQELEQLVRKADDRELDVLCEVHDEDELCRALDAGCNLIGVNSRDLRTFKVDLGTAFRLSERIPDGILAVAESGIESGIDIARLRSAGYKALLVGES